VRGLNHFEIFKRFDNIQILVHQNLTFLSSKNLE
jgi:hypothetical protein